jgi:hypothetical protein
MKFSHKKKTDNFGCFRKIYFQGYNRDIRKVRKRQHEYPEFGHTQGVIKKNLQKSTLTFNGVSFFLSASIAAT